jgi:hypothetical protein
MKTTESLFQQSIDKYQVIIQTSTVLREQMGSMTPEEILAVCYDINTLQSAQKKNDLFIIEVMNDYGPSILGLPCVLEYKDILNKALVSCDKTLAQGKVIRSLLQSDINTLQKGQQCLAGYNPVSSNSSKSFKS